MKGADALSIEEKAETQLDTLAAFDELSALAGASGRWLAGLAEVQKAAATIRPALVVDLGQRHYETGRLRIDRADMRGDWEVTDTSYSKSTGYFASHTEGKTFQLSVSPGTVALSGIDPNKAEKAATRAYDEHYNMVDIAAGWLDLETGEYDPDAVFGCAEISRTEVTHWSKRSRMRMVRAVAELDYSDWLPSAGDLAMVTLTLPDIWYPLAPDGKAFKKLVRISESAGCVLSGSGAACGSWNSSGAGLRICICSCVSLHLWADNGSRRGSPKAGRLCAVPPRSLIVWTSTGAGPRSIRGIWAPVRRSISPERNSVIRDVLLCTSWAIR